MKRDLLLEFTHHASRFGVATGCSTTRDSFYNTSDAPVSWLETFTPQPPAQHVFRFFGEWEARGREIEA